MATRLLAAALATCTALAGCANKTEQARAPRDLGHLQQTGCYTVDLFDPVEVADPHPDLAPDQAAWLGHWGGGVWNGSWCHEMIVTRVSPEGRVTLLDMHAPSETFSAPATVFRRTARLFDDGSLRFRHGTVVRRYEMRGDRLYGRREGDGNGPLEIVLTRDGGASGAQLAQN